jgi:peptide/nickel transport system substrate-binding protein
MPLNLKRPHLQDRRVRQAIDLALDRQAIVVNALPGAGRAAYQPVPPASWAFSEDLDRPYTDLEKAMELLDEAGWYAGPDGMRRRGYRPKVKIASMAALTGEEDREEAPLTLRLIVWKDEAFRLRAAQMIRRQLRRVGIRVDLELVDNAAYSRLAEDMGEEFDGFIGGWGSLLDPGDNLYKKFHSRGSQNYMTYRNETVDRMLDQCRTATDPEAAKGFYRRLMAHLRREAVFLPLAYPDYLFAARERVAGVKEAVVDSWYEFTRHAWRWRLEED